MIKCSQMIHCHFIFKWIVYAFTYPFSPHNTELKSNIKMISKKSRRIDLSPLGFVICINFTFLIVQWQRYVASGMGADFSRLRW